MSSVSNFWYKSKDQRPHAGEPAFPASHEMKLRVKVEVKATSLPKLISSTSTGNLNLKTGMEMGNMAQGLGLKKIFKSVQHTQWVRKPIEKAF